MWLRPWMFLPHEAGILREDLGSSFPHFSYHWGGHSKADRSTVNCSGLCDCGLLLGKFRKEWGQEWRLFSFFATADSLGQMRNHFQMGEQRWENTISFGGMLKINSFCCPYLHSGIHKHFGHYWMWHKNHHSHIWWVCGVSPLLLWERYCTTFLQQGDTAHAACPLC